MLDSMTKTIMILVIAAALVAGSLVTGTAAFAAPGEQGKPFEFLQAQIDDIISGATGGTVTSVATGTGLTGGPITTSGTISVDLNQIQSRVTGTCPSGSSIRAISPSGTVTCELDNGSFLGVSRQVATGTVPALGSVTLSINCPSDRVVVGGGYLAIQSLVVSNHPDTITSWRIQAINPTTVADPFTAYAMCLDNTP